MKKKTLKKRLWLNRETVVNLNIRELHEVYGGGKCDTNTTTCNPVCNFIESFCGGPVTCPTLTGDPQSDVCCLTC